MELPLDLRNALESELSSLSSRRLAGVVSELSGRYRNNKPTSRKSFIKSREEVNAYVAFRMPATYAAVYSALRKVKEILPQWNPETFMDAGAGPGTAIWAALEVYPGLRAATLLEREEDMIELGMRLAKYSSSGFIQNAEWIRTDITGDWNTSSHDLVTASYVLGEIDEQHRNDFIRKLWQVTANTLVIIEPGTPAGFSRIKQAREILVGERALIVAPCPGNMSCPIKEDNWCHFSQRISRSRLHKQVKAGELSYEDEKFSFIAVSRLEGRLITGRVLRHPQIRKGHIEFEICSPDGISRKTVTRKNKELYRIAKDLSWGSVFPENE